MVFVRATVVARVRAWECRASTPDTPRPGCFTNREQRLGQIG